MAKFGIICVTKLCNLPTLNQYHKPQIRFGLHLIKPSLELWQIFTVLTVIFSLSSSVLWFNQIAPNNNQNELSLIDQSKSYLYNQYLSDALDLKKVSLANPKISEDCKYQNTKNQNTEILHTLESSKKELEKKEDQIMKELVIYKNKSGIEEIYGKYIQNQSMIINGLNNHIELEKMYDNLAKDEQIVCLDNLNEQSKMAIINDINAISKLNVNSKILENNVAVVEKLKGVQNGNEYLEILKEVKIDDFDYRISQTNEDIVQKIKEIEVWQKKQSSKNNLEKAKFVYIF
jgi:hypothetical protein